MKRREKTISTGDNKRNPEKPIIKSKHKTSQKKKELETSGESKVMIGWWPLGTKSCVLQRIRTAVNNRELTIGQILLEKKIEINRGILWWRHW